VLGDTQRSIGLLVDDLDGAAALLGEAGVVFGAVSWHAGADEVTCIGRGWWLQC
jgi:hypothetical protein